MGYIKILAQCHVNYNNKDQMITIAQLFLQNRQAKIETKWHFLFMNSQILSPILFITEVLFTLINVIYV